MEEKRYTVSELAELAGVSPRTLRYYDEIGLVSPVREANGYRRYENKEVRRLQHVMLLRSCGLPLAEVEAVLSDEGASLDAVLREHLVNLEKRSGELARNIATTKRMIDGLEGFDAMNDEEKFEQLKRDSVARFEDEWGEESRALYGDVAIDEANDRLLGMSKCAWDAKEELEQRIKEVLAAAMKMADPLSPESRMCADMHAQWIKVHWGEGNYSSGAHVQLAQGYLGDPRLIEYYDSACGKGATEFLTRIISENIGS